MRHLLYFLILSMCFENSFGQSVPVMVNVNGETVVAYENSYALVIGISNYTFLKKLDKVKEDVVSVRDALTKNGFDVTVKTDLDKNQIDAEITDFIKNYGQNVNNRLLIYFAGHGYTQITSYGGELGYFVPVDAPKPSDDGPGFRRKSIDMLQFEIYAINIQSKHALFIFDACFAGNFFQMNNRSLTSSVIINNKTKEPVRQFITSGGQNEEVPDKSIFCEEFVRAITTTYADANNDQYLTFRELGDFLQEKVVNYSKDTQHPQVGTIRNKHLDKGDFVFFLPAEEAPVTDSPEVQVDQDLELPSYEFMDDLVINGYPYRTVQLGNQIWMYSNLNYETGNSWCYYGKEEYCPVFGRLYDWETAVKVCPEGWRLPGDVDWKELEMFLGISVSEVDSTFRRGTNEGAKMHSVALALPFSGLANPAENYYDGINSSGVYWSSTESSDPTQAWIRSLYNDDGRVYRDVFGKEWGLSVRCMKGAP